MEVTIQLKEIFGIFLLNKSMRMNGSFKKSISRIGISMNKSK